MPAEVLSHSDRFHDVHGLPDQHVVLVNIPGNPGAPVFYDSFGNELFAASDGRLGVCTVGHANHSKHAVQEHELFNLEDQVAHKIHVLREMLHHRPTMRLVLCGHSVGAHMCLEAMKVLPAENVLKCVLLFPTVMHIGSTPNGTKLMPVFTHARGVAGAAAWAVSKLPHSLKRGLLRWHMGRDHAEAVEDLVHRTVAQNCLYMAYHEMREILEVDEANLSRFQDKCVFYFTPKDEWAPVEQFRDVQARFPRAEVHLCPDDIPHAFVLGHAEVMARKVWGWLREDIEAELARGDGSTASADSAGTGAGDVPNASTAADAGAGSDRAASGATGAAADGGREAMTAAGAGVGAGAGAGAGPEAGAEAGAAGVAVGLAASAAGREGQHTVSDSAGTAGTEAPPGSPTPSPEVEPSEIDVELVDDSR